MIEEHIEDEPTVIDGIIPLSIMRRFLYTLRCCTNKHLYTLVYKEQNHGWITVPRVPKKPTKVHKKIDISKMNNKGWKWLYIMNHNVGVLV